MSNTNEQQVSFDWDGSKDKAREARVGVLLGGLGPEREISKASGLAVVDALKSLGYNAFPVDVDRNFDRTLAEEPMDLAFVALHGTYGEDGVIQGLLELKGIPYTGSSVLASALAMDKVKAKELFRLYNVPTAPYYELRQKQLAGLEELHGSFGFPVFVKPRRTGSSVGCGRADNLLELRKRCEEALQLDSGVVIERHIVGMEVNVAILDGQALGAVEIVPKGEFYDYASKYTEGGSEYHVPPRLSAERLRNVMSIAERAHRSLGCTGVTRVDLLVTETENEFVLEVNTVPGMTATSLVPKIAKSVGYSFAEVCEAILVRAALHAPGTNSPRVSTQTRRPSIEPADGRDIKSPTAH